MYNTVLAHSFGRGLAGCMFSVLLPHGESIFCLLIISDKGLVVHRFRPVVEGRHDLWNDYISKDEISSSRRVEGTWRNKSSNARSKER